WARQVHLGFPEAAEQLKPGPRTEVLSLGNPIRPPDPALDRSECRRRFGLEPHGVVVRVVGGSQGARAVNEALLSAIERVEAGALPPRPAGLQVLWATGPAHIAGVQERLRRLEGAGWVRAFGYIDEMPAALAAADVAVSRAGAMATAELLAWGIPSILVPLPTAAADHQTGNARALAEAGAAVHLPQAEATPERLWAEVTFLVTSDARRDAMSARARARARPHAARDIARRLLTLVEQRAAGTCARPPSTCAGSRGAVPSTSWA